MSSYERKNPLILRYHRLMDAFSKSDDERDFYLDKLEGFILFADLDKDEDELNALVTEVEAHKGRYFLLPKLTFYETKKIMEEFVNEKVYDIDTKDKLLDVISSKDARENFLEFIYDHLTEVEKWHQYYQERSRVRIIEWLRLREFDFVFEEDLEMPADLIERLKEQQFSPRVTKEIADARKALESRAKTYYSNEALNPRPKRGRPPKQAPKIEIDVRMSRDVYVTVPPTVLTFLYVPDITSASSVTFSAKFDSEEDLLANLRRQSRPFGESKLNALSKKLEALCRLSGFAPTTIESLAPAKEQEPLHTPNIVKTSSRRIEKASKSAPARIPQELVTSSAPKATQKVSVAKEKVSAPLSRHAVGKASPPKTALNKNLSKKPIKVVKKTKKVK